MQQRLAAGALSKVPAVTLAFWAIKICATTLGETGGDAASMTLDLGYALSSVIFLAMFAIALAVQVASDRYRPFVYWAVVVATTTVGTTMSDFLDRTAGLGYVKASALLLAGLIGVLLVWQQATGAIEFEDITSRPNEAFYWLTILVSNTLGTALGDFVASDAGLGFGGGAAVFATLLALVAGAHFLSSLPESLLFWAAYILTRPLGATLGDTLTKPGIEGGLGLSRIVSSLTLAVVMVVAILLTAPRVARAAAAER